MRRLEKRNPSNSQGGLAETGLYEGEKVVVEGEKCTACELNAKRVPVGRVVPFESVRGEVQIRIILTKAIRH